MPMKRTTLMMAALVGAVSALTTHAADKDDLNVELGPRPFYLVDRLQDGELKYLLKGCAQHRRYFKQDDFSIGHRGAPLQFPEHTKESYEAAARMGAGILECDVTFTQDQELVCRHAQCDLHTTTDIVAREDLRGKCQVPPEFDTEGNLLNGPDIQCCASDLTLDEFKSLCGKMDASNADATTIEEYLGGTANWRTDLYSTCGTVVSHKESIELFKGLGAKMTPELKAGNDEDVEAVFGSQEQYAQAMIDDYKEAGVDPQNVYAQSFNPNDILYWIEKEPAFGEQAVYLDNRYDDNPPLDPNDPRTWSPTMEELAAQGVNIIAPPMWVLLTVKEGRIMPSEYAEKARAAGLDIITWTLERSGRMVEDVLPTQGTDSPSFYYQSTLDALQTDGDILTTVDVLAQQVGVLGIFSDWPATTTFYANCIDP